MYYIYPYRQGYIRHFLLEVTDRISLTQSELPEQLLLWFSRLWLAGLMAVV